MSYDEYLKVLLIKGLKKMNYVYIVECRDGTLYTGWTTDVNRRITEHNEGRGAKYTRGREPIVLKHLEEYETKQQAMKRECAIKKLSRKKKIELINSQKAFKHEV